MPNAAQAELTVVCEFPEKYFLENLAVRGDGSILVTVANTNELWLVPSPGDTPPVKPLLLHTFAFNATFIVEWQSDRFLVGVADVYKTRRSQVYEVDLRAWNLGRPIVPRLVLELPEPLVGLNGGCMIAPDVLLAAGVTDLIWRVDLSPEGNAQARVWLEHDSMKFRPGEKKPEQPGTNGVRYAAKTGYVYFTTTSQQMMLRVRVDAETLQPADFPEFIAGGRQWDDFILDEDAGVAYVTTHRENTIDRVRLEPDGNREGRAIVAGKPFDELLVGPSSGAWRRYAGDYGRTAYVTTDGGTAQSPDGKSRTAKLLRVDFVNVGRSDE